jgi:hypothetical protein
MNLLGFKCTRFDAFVDFVGQDVQLVDRWLGALNENERQLCLSKSWGVDERHGRHGPTGRMVTVGKRGDGGSGRYGRIYDKGLETKLMPVGEWERFEVEFSGDCAQQVLMSWLESGEPEQVLAETIMGSFDLRQVNGRRELSLRDRLAWWADLVRRVCTASVLVRAKPVAATLAGTVGWLRTAVVGRVRELGVLMGTGMDVAALLTALGESLPVDLRESIAGRQLRAYIEEVEHARVLAVA